MQVSDYYVLSPSKQNNFQSHWHQPGSITSTELQKHVKFKVKYVPKTPDTYYIYDMINRIIMP